MPTKTPFQTVTGPEADTTYLRERLLKVTIERDRYERAWKELLELVESLNCLLAPKQ